MGRGGSGGGGRGGSAVELALLIGMGRGRRGDLGGGGGGAAVEWGAMHLPAGRPGGRQLPSGAYARWRRGQ